MICLKSFFVKDKNMPTKYHSLIESVINVLMGYWVAVISQTLICPVFDIQITFHNSLLIGAWYTVILLITSCILRYFFSPLEVGAN